LQETNEYKWQTSILLKIFKALSAAGRKRMITGVFLMKNKILEVPVSPFYEQITRFGGDSHMTVCSDETFINSSHTKKKFGLMILPRDTWCQPLITVSWNKNVFQSWHITHFELNQKMCYILCNI
jgi:hypothetical protein